MNKQALDHSIEFINSWLQFRYERDDIPGYSVAIAHEGKMIFHGAYGYADFENKTKLTVDRLFRIASHSKTFTATALMLLAEEGKLRIDDYIVDYLPWLSKHKDSRWSKVTIRQLMSHSAGVIRDGEEQDYWQLEKPFPGAAQFKKEIMETKLVVDNNTKLKYSNYGYTLLGLIIETVSGQSYNDFVNEQILKPLKLDNTTPEITKDNSGRVVTGYSRPDLNKKRLPIAQIDTGAMAPAAGFCSNTEDLCKYFTAHMIGSGKLLSDESKKEMQRVQWHVKAPNQSQHEDYGLGLEIEFLDNRRVIGHGGGFPGQSTSSLFDPKDKLVVIVLTNCIDSPPVWISKGIYGIITYFQENTSSSKPKHDLKNLEGRYMNLWAMTDIVVTGDKVVASYPDSWEPLTAPDKLEYIDSTTFKISDTDSFGSEDELVHFHLTNGIVEKISYAGSTMWPEKVWLEKQKGRKIVEIPKNR